MHIAYTSTSNRQSHFPYVLHVLIYANRIPSSMRQVDSMLDMGAGGGEFLAMLTPLPRSTWATEGYRPNVTVARAKLGYSPEFPNYRKCVGTYTQRYP